MARCTISSKITCQSCGKQKANTRTAVVKGVYYKNVCNACLGSVDVSSNAAGYERRRGYEDNAQETIQPYDANGPNKEFLRLYPEQAKKVFSPEVIKQLKRKI